jgi:hypothetical protein
MRKTWWRRPLPGLGIVADGQQASGAASRSSTIRRQPALPAGAVGIGQLGSGHGLTGLAERTAALGGTIHSGPVPAGGWRLSAELPATA